MEADLLLPILLTDLVSGQAADWPNEADHLLFLPYCIHSRAFHSGHDSWWNSGHLVCYVVAIYKTNAQKNRIYQ
jgi:hypothetical protein